MSRLLSLLALALLVAAPAAFAQGYGYRPGPTVGLKAGLNVADLYGSDAPANTDPRLGFSGGLTADIPVTPLVSVRPEILYTQKGTSSSTSDATLSLDYVEVPVLVGVTVPATDTGLMIGAYAGPSIAFKVRESANFFSGTSDVFRDTDFGGAFGVTVGAGPFGVDARYTVGLQNAIDGDLLGANEVRNGVFTVSGVYHFGR